MDKKVPIIVTGSAGRIGTAVCKRLGDKYPIIGFELQKAIYASSREELIPVDIGSDESVIQAFTHIRNFYGNKIAAVIHLAAYYSFSEEHSDNYEKITVKGTERLLLALQGFEVEQFIFTSTMLVHKPTEPGIDITEDSPVEPNWDYPKSKVRTEEKIHELRGNIPSVILRIAGVYDNKCHSIPISHQIQRIYEKQLESRVFAGNASHGAAFIHMDDLVDAIEKAVENRKSLPAETVLLLGEEKTLSYDQLQRKISELLFHKEFTTIRVPKCIAFIGAWLLCHIPFRKKPFIQPWMIKIADDHYQVDISRAKQLLNWAPKKQLETILPVMIEDLKKDPKAWYAVNQLNGSK
jgi:nucleoside-diphosphate-sugar epimerase